MPGESAESLEWTVYYTTNDGEDGLRLPEKHQKATECVVDLPILDIFRVFMTKQTVK